MPYSKCCDHSFHQLMDTLRMLKMYHDIGIYDEVVRGAEQIAEDDWYEFAELGIENVAPFFDFKDISLNEDAEQPAEEEREDPDIYYDEHTHRLYCLSSPELKEYYRLCRLYEYREKIEPHQNPFVIRANKHYESCIKKAEGYFGFGFNDNNYFTELIVEVCPDNYCVQPDLVEALHYTLEYYRRHLDELRLELLMGPPVFLPALPAPKSS